MPRRVQKRRVSHDCVYSSAVRSVRTRSSSCRRRLSGSSPNQPIDAKNARSAARSSLCGFAIRSSRSWSSREPASGSRHATREDEAVELGLAYVNGATLAANYIRAGYELVVFE